MYGYIHGTIIDYTAGEPLSETVRKWAFEVVGEGHCTYIDTWSQTGMVQLWLNSQV